MRVCVCIDLSIYLSIYLSIDLSIYTISSKSIDRLIDIYRYKTCFGRARPSWTESSSKSDKDSNASSPRPMG